MAMDVKVADLSRFNFSVDLDELAGEADGVIVRLGYRSYQTGALKLDACFWNTVCKLIDEGIPWGFIM